MDNRPSKNTPPAAPALKPEAPTGTLATAIAQMDMFLDDDEAAVPQLMAEAWATCRQAAFQSLEIPAVAAAPRGSAITDQARKVVTDVMHHIVRAEPSADAAASFAVKAQAAGLVLLGLAVEAIDRIAARSEDINEALSTLAANVEQANRMGWGQPS